MGAKETDLLAYCGLYCGACSFKVAFEEDDRGHLASMPAKYDKFKGAQLEDCPGCRANAQDSECRIRRCAQKKNLLHCGDCGDFPCKLVVDFSSDGTPHHAEIIANLRAVRQMGVDAWLADQKNRSACSCGKRLSWYVKKCIHKM